MASFDVILEGAKQLSTGDQMRLIDALWEDAPEDAGPFLHPEWEAELERRVAAIRAGTAKTVPWTTIRDEALARIGHGTSH